jgi:hypothetical protein
MYVCFIWQSIMTVRCAWLLFVPACLLSYILAYIALPYCVLLAVVEALPPHAEDNLHVVSCSCNSVIILYVCSGKPACTCLLV